MLPAPRGETHASCPSEVLLQLRVLLCQLEQHGIVEELVHRHVLAETLASAHFQHELAGQVRGGSRLKRSQENGPVQRVSRHELPVVKHRHAHCLPGRVRPQVCLETEGFHGGQIGMDSVHGAPRLRQIAHDVATAPRKHVVDGRDAIRWAFDLGELDRFHQPRRGQQKGGISHTPRSGDDLAAATHHRILGKLRIQDLKLHTPNPFVAQGPLLGGPLEALDQTFFRLPEHRLVDFAREGVVHEYVWTVAFRAECPDGPSGQEVPIVVFREKVAQAPWVPVAPDPALLDILPEALLQGLGDHVELVFLIRRLGEAFQRAGLHDRLAEFHDRVCDLDLQVAIEASEVVQDAVQIDFPCSGDHMLAAFFDFRLRQRIRLVDLPQAVDHLRQFRRLERFDGDLNHCRRGEAQRLEDFDLFLVGRRGDRGRLLDRALDASDEHPIPSGHVAHLHSVTTFVNPEVLHLSNGHVLVVIEGESLAKDLDTVAPEQSARHHATEDVEGVAIRAVVVLHRVYHEVPCRVQRLHVGGHSAVLVTGIKPFRLCCGVFFRAGDVCDDHVHERSNASPAPEELQEDLLQQRPRVKVVIALVQIDAHLGQRRCEVFLLLSQAMGKYLVDRLENELYEGTRLVSVWRVFLEAVRILIVVEVAPQTFRELFRLEATTVDV
mmetsp:Transcript_101971/g.287842  ORF Transcript_101971/g.287842 Transcript_101971/m.287842 type:complete len:664 (+) Transcript_101971:115-2106(+)